MYVFKIEPLPVSGLHVVFVGVTKVTLAWKNDNGTAAYRMLLEDTGSHKELVNISGLKPGSQYSVTLHLLESHETQRESLVIGNGSGELQGCASYLLYGFSFQFLKILFLYLYRALGFIEGPLPLFSLTPRLYEEGRKMV